MPKSTVAFRVPEDAVSLIDVVADVEGAEPSDCYRDAVGQFIAKIASENPEFAARVNATAQERLERNLAEITTLFGEQVLDHLQIKRPQ